MGFRLTWEGPFVYIGNQYECAIHLRVYTGSWRRPPVVIAGRFHGDMVGATPGTAYQLAAAVQHGILRNGRNWQLVLHDPGDGPFSAGHPMFQPVTFAERSRCSRAEQRRLRATVAAYRSDPVAVDVYTVAGVDRHPLGWAIDADNPWKFAALTLGRELRIKWPSESGRYEPDRHQEFGPLAQATVARLPDLLGDAPVRVWPMRDYVPKKVLDEAGAAAVARCWTASRQALRAEVAALDSLVDPSNDVMVDLHRPDADTAAS